MKKNVLSTIVYLVFLIIFNLIFYMLGGTEHPASVWISYVFIHIAYLLLVCTTLFVRKGSNAALFGMTLNSISGVYFVVELIVGIIFIKVASESYKAPLIVQAVIASVYVVLLIANIQANDSTADSVERHELEVKYLKEAAMILKKIMGMVDDKTANKKVEKVYDLIQSSPAKSNRNVADLEFQIISEIEQLRMIASGGDAEAVGMCADKIYRLAGERNRQLKLGN